MKQESLTKLLYEVQELPVFQNRMYGSEVEGKECPKGNIRLVENSETGLIYNETFYPELMEYDKNYQNEQGVSPFFKRHLRDVASIIENVVGKENLVEVGCGKGFFLEMLIDRGFKVTGFDPTYEGSNPNIERRYFTSNVGLQGKALILRHVLEHIQNPVDFLFQLKDANGGRGKIYIEVPCFDWICQHRAWFDIFYEHVNYFRLSDFHRLFGEVLDSGKLFGDQYLYVVAELASLQLPKIDRDNLVNFPFNFLENLTKHGKMGQEKKAIWGGASKGVIFALLSSRLGQPVDVVIDLNPAKQNKYLPSTGLRVSSPQEVFELLPEGSTLFVMNSNYLEEIKAMSKYLFNYVSIDHD